MGFDFLSFGLFFFNFDAVFQYVKLNFSLMPVIMKKSIAKVFISKSCDEPFHGCNFVSSGIHSMSEGQWWMGSTWSHFVYLKGILEGTFVPWDTQESTSWHFLHWKGLQ